MDNCAEAGRSDAESLALSQSLAQEEHEAITKHPGWPPSFFSGPLTDSRPTNDVHLCENCSSGAPCLANCSTIADVGPAPEVDPDCLTARCCGSKAKHNAQDEQDGPKHLTDKDCIDIAHTRSMRPGPDFIVVSHRPARNDFLRIFRNEGLKSHSAMRREGWRHIEKFEVTDDEEYRDELIHTYPLLLADGIGYGWTCFDRTVNLAVPTESVRVYNRRAQNEGYTLETRTRNWLELGMSLQEYTDRFRRRRGDQYLGMRGEIKDLQKPCISEAKPLTPQEIYNMSSWPPSTFREVVFAAELIPTCKHLQNDDVLAILTRSRSTGASR